VSSMQEAVPGVGDPGCCGAVFPVLRVAAVTFHPGERLRCPGRIARGRLSGPCRRPIEIDLPPQTVAEVRVVELTFRPGEVQVWCKRCKSQLGVMPRAVA
jgi:hypothetical protein